MKERNVEIESAWLCM